MLPKRNKYLKRSINAAGVIYNHCIVLHKRYYFLGGNRVRIGNRVYQFWKSKEIEGTIKTITIKRTPLRELFLAAVVVNNISDLEIKSATSKIAGFDFGLKTFLTCFDIPRIPYKKLME